MSDKSVVIALRSQARLVIVEAPAGCGKTYQGAAYAREISEKISPGRLLILAHTHAACDIFASRTSGRERHVDIRTIDSLINQIAAAYHITLGLPQDIGAWVQSREDGYSELASMVANLLSCSPMIAQALAKRYPIIICDEHQDASEDQHKIIMSCFQGGASLRIFGDPMQRIYGSRNKKRIEADIQRWEDLKNEADTFEELNYPHRWAEGSYPLGHWILNARMALQSGGCLDLSGHLPSGVRVIFAENKSPRTYGGYSLEVDEAKRIYENVNATSSLLVLSAHNGTVGALRAFFNRRLPIWEGHVRENLEALVIAEEKYRGDAKRIAQAVVMFLNKVTKGFTMSSFGNTLCNEVCCGCVAERKGRKAILQELGRMIINQPDHKGVAKVLYRLSKLIKADPSFKNVIVDYSREFWEAVSIGKFDNPCEGFSEISRRRSYCRPLPPDKAISTIHKAKGLECNDVLIIPCDSEHFGNSINARCRLYVAMSRARHSLTFVVSRKKPSSLIKL